MLLAELTLVATWYAQGLRNPEALSCATRAFPRYQLICLVYKGRHTGPVIVNDWPEDPTPGLVDLSRGAFRKLAPLRRGRIYPTLCREKH